MIHEIGRELAAVLKDKGCPYAVITGPEATETATFGRSRIIIEENGGDEIGPVVSVHKNPKHVEGLTIGARITIYVQWNAAGSLLLEHRREARHVLRMVIDALRYVLTLRRNPVTFGKGDWIDAPVLEASERPAGVIYQFGFSFLTGVPDLTWADLAKPEATVGPGGVSIKSTTKVSTLHGPDNDSDPDNIPAAAETACGS